MKVLYLIPARSGSKGIPGKNMADLNGRPLISYTLEFAKTISSTEDILVSSDNPEIIDFAIRSGIPTDYLRPDELARDDTDMYDVILDAIGYCESTQRYYDSLLLLQPTSPFRNKGDIQGIYDLYADETDMVVSVRPSPFHPGKSYRENERGYLEKLTGEWITRRQDLGELFDFNGSVYLMRVESLKREHFARFRNIVKYEMDGFRSMDIDDSFDLAFAEFLLSHGYVTQ